MSQLDLTGKVAVITGGGSGIGAGAARSFAAAGADVAILQRSADSAEDVVKELQAMGRRAEFVETDVSCPEQIEAAMNHVAGVFGRIDIVFANAGINGVWAPIEQIREDEYDKTMDINLKGTFFTIQAAMPYLRQAGGGSIVVTSSVNGTRMFSNTGATVYAMTKAGQTVLVKMLAPELGPQGIRINVICPGAIKTNIGENTEQRNTESIGMKVEYPEGEIPLTGQEPGDPSDVGDVALFLVSDLARHVTGEVVYVDGGQSLVQG